MKHHCASIAHHNFNSILSCTILMMRTDAAKLYSLTFVGYFFHKLLRIEYAVVSVERANGNARLRSFLLEFYFGLYYFRGSETVLVLNRNVARGSVIEERTADVF
jgi:hypothetical protein